MKSNTKTGGEFQLTDALQNMLDENEKFVTSQIQGWLDCGEASTLLETNRYLLKKLYGKNIHRIKGGKIIEPVFIGKKVTLKNAVIGPNATINDGCSITNSTVTDSIVGSDNHIENSHIDESIIGNNSIIKNVKLKLNVGDNSEIYNNK
jgi:glucose-1-phosphate thymidylyltransferase